MLNLFFYIQQHKATTMYPNGVKKLLRKKKISLQTHSTQITADPMFQKLQSNTELTNRQNACGCQQVFLYNLKTDSWTSNYKWQRHATVAH